MIYRANLDRSHPETVFLSSNTETSSFLLLSHSCIQNSHQFLPLDLIVVRRMDGLAFDRVAGNIYVAVSGSYRESGGILACETKPGGTFTCANVLSEGEGVKGIALNPIEG